MATRKISITVDEELVDEVKARVGDRGVSRFVSAAIEEAIGRQRDQELLGEFVDELEAELGPRTAEDEAFMARIDAAFAQVERAKREMRRRGK